MLILASVLLLFDANTNEFGAFYELISAAVAHVLFRYVEEDASFSMYWVYSENQHVTDLHPI